MIIFDELAFAEKMSKHGFIKCFSIYELSIYAKYLKSQNKTKEDIEKSLIEFSNKWNNDFIYDVDYRKIDKAVKSVDEYTLRTTIPTYITENEWKKILSINDENYRRVLFVMLVISKYYKSNNTKISEENINNKYSDTYFCNFSDVDIMNISNVKFKDVDSRNKMFNYFQNEKILDITHGKKSIRIVKFINNEGKIKETVTDYENIILYYEKLIGEKIGECKECSKLFRQSKQNNTEYCNKHKGYSPMETKNINCIDCGNDVEVDAKDNKTCRCSDCQDTRDKETKKERNNRYYKKKNKN